MAAIVPAIHAFLLKLGQVVDARHEAGHDGGQATFTRRKPFHMAVAAPDISTLK